eukprot:198128-Pyramimonas_sp.AAC.1
MVQALIGDSGNTFDRANSASTQLEYIPPTWPIEQALIGHESDDHDDETPPQEFYVTWQEVCSTGDGLPSKRARIYISGFRSILFRPIRQHISFREPLEPCRKMDPVPLS